jgi:hypothetical protein
MTKITVAKRDVIGLKMMEATLKILKAPTTQLDIEEIVMAEKMYLNGNSSCIANTHKSGNSHKLAGKQALVNSVIYRLIQKTTTLKAVDYSKLTGNFNIKQSTPIISNKNLVCINAQLNEKMVNAFGIINIINSSGRGNLNLTMITKRVTKVWHNGFPETI